MFSFKICFHLQVCFITSVLVNLVPELLIFITLTIRGFCMGGIKNFFVCLFFKFLRNGNTDVYKKIIRKAFKTLQYTKAVRAAQAYIV